MANNDQKLQLTIAINAETGALEIVGQKIQETGQKAKKSADDFKGLSAEAGNLLKSFLPLATAGGVVAFFANAVKGAEEENQALLRVKGTLESLGQGWDGNREKITEWTNAVQLATRFSDGQALVALDKLTRATGNLSQAQSGAMLAMNLAVQSGKSLEETTEIVNGLLIGQTRALIQVNKDFAAFAGGAKTAQEALDNLQRSTSGTAQAEDNLTSKTLQMKNAWGEFSDQIGNTFVPAIKFAVEIMTQGVKVMETWGTLIAVQVKIAIDSFMSLSNVLSSILTGSPLAVKDAVTKAMNELKIGVQVGADEVRQIWENNNQRLNETDLARLQAKQQINAQEITQEREKMMQLEMLERDLNQQLQSIGEQTFQKKRALMEQEIAQERVKAQKIARSKVELEMLNQKIDKIHAARTIDLGKQEVAFKQDQALQIASTAIQTLQVVNSLGEKGSSAEKARAKALLALQQAVTIGWIWVAAAKSAGETGIFGAPAVFALGAAQTALAVAQFASQSKAIDKAAARESQDVSGISLNSIGPGIDLGAGGPAGVDLGGGGLNTPAGRSSVGGGGGGGGGGVVINVGGIVQNFDIEKISTENIKEVMRRIREEGRAGTIEAIQLAVQLDVLKSNNPNIAA